MKEPLFYKLKRHLYRIICRLTHHDYGCCSKVFKSCYKCEKMMGETEIAKMERN